MEEEAEDLGNLPDEPQSKDLNEALSALLQPVSGDEAILKVAVDYAMQLTPEQIKALQYLDILAFRASNNKVRDFILTYKDNWIMYQKHNNSMIFIDKIIESLSFRKFFPNAGLLDLQLKK